MSSQPRLGDFDWKVAGFVVLAGAVGGAVSIVYSMTMGTQPKIEPFPFGVFAYALLGAAAAFLGVFLIARTDSRYLNHCLGLALACGISWAPVFDAASALVKTRQDQKNNRETQAQIESTKATIAKLDTTDASALNSQAGHLVKQIASLSVSARATNDRSLLANVEETFSSAADAIQKAGKSDPEVSKQTLPFIASARINAGLPGTPSAPVNLLEFRGPVAKGGKPDGPEQW